MTYFGKCQEWHKEINDLIFVVIWINIWIQEFLKDFLTLHSKVILGVLGIGRVMHYSSALVLIITDKNRYSLESEIQVSF